MFGVWCLGFGAWLEAFVEVHRVSIGLSSWRIDGAPRGLLVGCYTVLQLWVLRGPGTLNPKT